jgi:hypothetical protein
MSLVLAHIRDGIGTLTLNPPKDSERSRRNGRRRSKVNSSAPSRAPRAPWRD